MKKRFFPRWILLLFMLALLLSGSAYGAGMVTDNLTVKVGYFGMSTDDYVEVGTWNWSQLETDLPLHQVAYSFYRPGEDGTYRTVIDSACGFYISDLMDYANINLDDITEIQFYTQDQDIGSFTSFTAQELFRTERYYFNDLAAHLHVIRGEDGTITGIDSNDAWDDKTVVPPMLALEDDWEQYDLGTEHTEPNFTALGTGNRFRLLFGQSEPTECRTNQTAKYTHTLYVTLQGAPEISLDQPELDGTIGSHTTSASVVVGNGSILSQIQGLLKLSSSDESVMTITGYTVTPSSEYSDLAKVTIQYDVRSQGAATMSIGVGSSETASATAELTTPQPAAPVSAEPASEPSAEPSQAAGDSPEPTAAPQTAASAVPSSAAPTSGVSGAKTSAPSQASGGSAQTSPAASSASTGAPAADTASAAGTSSPAPSGGEDYESISGTGNAQSAEATDTSGGTNQSASGAGTQSYRLNPSLAARLGGDSGTKTIRSSSDAAEQKTVAVTVQPTNTRPYVIGSALFGAAFCLLGALCAAKYYQKEMRA